MSYDTSIDMGGVQLRKFRPESKVDASFHANRVREIRHFPPTEERDREFFILELENHEGTELSVFVGADTLASLIEQGTEALAGSGVKVLVEV